MKSTVAKAIAVGLIPLLVMYFFSPAVVAQSIGVGPSTLQIDSAIRGEEYNELIVVFNPGNEQGDYALSASGDAGHWLSLWKQDAQDTRADILTIPSKGEASILVKIAVPKDAANGKHEAAIVVSNTPVGKAPPGIVNVGLIAQVAVTIMVTGGEMISVPVLPTPTRAGSLIEISVQGDPAPGSVVTIIAKFVNTGQIETKAKFVGEAYCDSRLFDRVNSEEVLVPTGKSAMLKSNLRLEAAGKYEIKGYVDYEGKKTEMKEVPFAVGGGGGATGAQPSLPFSLLLPIIGVIVALVAAIIYMALRRRKQA